MNSRSTRSVVVERNRPYRPVFTGAGVLASEAIQGLEEAMKVGLYGMVLIIAGTAGCAAPSPSTASGDDYLVVQVGRFG